MALLAKFMIETQLYSEIETILGLESGTISGHERFEDLVGWDSLAVVMLMAVAAEKFNCELTGEAIAACATINDLKALIESRG